MFESYIKYYFMLAISFYIYGKMLNNVTTYKRRIINLLVFFLSNTLVYIVRLNFPHLTVMFLLVILFAHCYLTYYNPAKLTITTCILSLGLSYLLFTISTILASILLIFTYYFKSISKYIQWINLLISLILQICMSKIIFKIRRLKSGMPFLQYKISNSIGIFIACCIIIVSSFFTVLDKKNSLYELIILTATTLGIILVLWWKKQLTILYINRSFQNEINRLEAELKTLREDNERLGSIIHKDNKLIPAMVMAVKNAITSQDADNISQNSELNKLLTELDMLSVERSLLSTKQIQTQHSIINSDIIRLDMILNYMKQKAEKKGISFTMDSHIHVKDMLTNSFTEDILVTIIADLIDNAIIATNLSLDNKSILVNFSEENNIFSINVYDSGIPFEPYTIKNAGKKKASTHTDTGGSGIGLMTTFILIKECRASFVIDETIDSELYTKKVSIIFDSLNEFRVYSHREEIIELKKEHKDILIN